MSGLTDEARALIGLHLASLRRHGWSADKALRLVADGFPAGAAQRELEEVAAALGRGDMPVSATDPFLALLARGDAAGPEALLESVKASQLAWAAKRSYRQAALVLSALAVGTGLMGLLGVGVVRAWQQAFQELGAALPAPTRMVFELTGYAGPIFVLALAFVPWLLSERRFPGVASYRAAARLRQFAAALAARVPMESAGPQQLFESKELGLSPTARSLGAFLLPRDGAEAVARTLAQELQSEAARKAEQFVGLAPVVGFVIVMLGITPVLVSLLLPLFTIAGAIR